jgi:nucleotide-binding universal stress UspA family protein
MMFKTILVAADQSEAAKAAYDFAVRLALEDRASVLLVNVVDASKLVAVAGYETPYPVDAVEMIRESAQQLLDELKANCEAKGLTVATVVGEGDAVEEIVRLANENGAGLICIGTHGRKGLARLFIGSVAEGVLRNAEVPVLVIRPPLREAPGEGSGKGTAAQAR